MASVWVLACIYSALTLHNDELLVREENIDALLKAVGVNIEPFWPSLFAQTLTHVNIVNIRSLVCKVGTGGSAPAAGPAPSTTAAPAEEKKGKAEKEESEESDDDVAFGL